MGPGWTWLHGTGTASKDSTDSGMFPTGNNRAAAAAPRGQTPGHLADPLETLLNQLNPPGLESLPEIPPELLLPLLHPLFIING